MHLSCGFSYLASEIYHLGYRSMYIYLFHVCVRARTRPIYCSDLTPLFLPHAISFLPPPFISAPRPSPSPFSSHRSNPSPSPLLRHLFLSPLGPPPRSAAPSPLAASAPPRQSTPHALRRTRGAVPCAVAGAPQRARHALRRWHNLIRRLELGQVLLAKVDTDDMPADFLTKFVPTAKLERSIRRATNAGAAVPPARA